MDYESDQMFAKIIRLLKNEFPADENGFSEIEHYVFDKNFGKPTSESELESIEELYERLTKSH